MFPSKRISFSPSSSPWKDEEWWGSASTTRKRYLPSEFCMESSLHGLRFIGQPKRHFVERLFWIIAFSVAVAVAIFFILQVWDKYRTTPVITVFQPKETPIDRIPFPAITICSTNNVIKSKAEEFIARVADNSDADAYSDLFLLDHVCQTASTFSETFNFSLEYGGLKKDVRNELIAFQNSNPDAFDSANKKITHVLKDVTQKCSSMILLCLWNDHQYSCDELFDEVETDFGYCCVFNMIPQSLLLKLRNDSRDDAQVLAAWTALDLDTDKLILEEDEAKGKYPYRQVRAGKTTGLSVLLDPDLDSYFCTNTDSVGFMALAHLPLDFPIVTDIGVAIRPNMETFLKILPEIITAEEGIRDFSLKQRNCYFGKEMSLKYYQFYTTDNCENECIANITYERCGCIRYFMPRDETQEICGAREFNCSQFVRKQLLQEGLAKRCKMCLTTCTDIEFHMSTSYLPLRADVPLWEHPNGSQASWVDKNVSLLHVHYSVDSTYPKLRKELYGFVDLLSNTGGLLGLCLGFSVLSLLEILYFVTLRLYCRTRRGKELGRRVDTLWDKALHSIMSKKVVQPSAPFKTEDTVLKNVLSKIQAPVFTKATPNNFIF